MTRFSYKTLLIITVFLLIPIVLLLRIQQKPSQKVLAGWWNESWTYRQAITITIPSSTADFTNLDTNISIGTSALVAGGKLQSDCDDLRFTNVNGQVLPYFIDSGCNSSSTKIWIRADLVPKNTTTYTVYVYYGNPAATSASDSTTFSLYNGLVGYWNFNEGAGTSATDSSVYNIGATLSGANWTTSGKYGVGISLNGTNQYVDIASTLAANTAANGKNTITFWMYWTGVTEQMPFSWKTNYYDLYLNGSAGSCFGFNTGSGDCWGTPTTGLANQWVHVATIFNNGSVQSSEIYINGTKRTLAQTIGSPATQSITNSAAYLGRWPTSGEYFGGKLDDVRIYNRALSSSEISNLYSNPGSISLVSPLASKPSTSFASEETGGGPIAWWKFDEGVGTTIYDASGKNSRGSISGATWQTDSQCLSGKCLYFDGVNDQITIPSLPTIKAPYTVSLWTKPQKLNVSQTIFAAHNGTSYPRFMIANNNRFLAYAGNEKYRYGSQVLTSADLNRWYQLTYVVADSSSLTNWKVYLNGQDISSTTGGNTGTYYEPTNPGYIGGISGEFFQGYLDDIKIYPYARTAAQIKADYTAGLAGMSTQNSTNTNFGSSSTGKSLSDGLVAYYKFDEGVGTTTADSSGNNNLATFGTGSSAPGWSPGKYGIGLSFDGSNDYANVSVGVSGQITVSAWIKSVYNNDYQNIVNGNGMAQYFSLYQGSLRVYTDSWRIASTTISDNTWAFVTLTYNDTTKNLKLYINGDVKYDGIETGSYTNNSVTIIGRYSTIERSFKGLLDEVRVYNRTLTPTEVKTLYQYAPGPVGYWKFDEGSGSTTYDSSGNSLNGTLGTGNSSPSWTIGKFGKGLNFQTTTQYVSVADNSLLKPNAITLEAWVNPSSYINWSTILMKSTVNNWNDGYGLAHYTDTNGVYFFVDNYNNYKVGTTVPTNVWTHVAGTYDGATLKIYNNGILANTANYTASINNSTAPVVIGQGTGGAFRWIGLVDEVKIYNYARTQSQILEDMGTGPNSKQPIIWYKFDEGYGATTNNSGIGGTLIGTLGTGTSSPTWTSGKFNQALNFNIGNSASTVYYNDVTNSPVDLTNNFSFGAWVYRTGTPSSQARIISKGGDIYLLYTETNNIPVCYMTNLSSRSLTASSALPLNQWTHVLCTYQDNVRKLYINGTLNAQDTPTGTITTDNLDLVIGNYDSPSLSFRFSGIIDDIKIFNYALSSDEIKTEYNAGASLIIGQSTQTIGATTTSLEYCIPGDTTYCAPPVGEWKFDEKIGTTAYDTSGNSNYGIFATGTSAPAWVSGKIGSGVSFDGNDSITVTNPASLNFGTGSFTLSTWIKTNQTTYGAIMNRYAPGYVYYINQTDGKQLLYFNDGSGTASGTSNSAINDNRWHHISFVADRANGLGRFYKDGIADGTLDISARTGSMNGNNLYFGYYPTQYFNGQMDHVRIYNYARSPAQIAYDYNQGGPVGWWKFDECQGAIANDSSGIGNSGTIVIGASGTQNTLGTCQVGTSAAWTAGATGKINSSLNFDGTDDYVNVTHHSSLKPTSSITFGSWFKTSNTNLDQRILSTTESGGYQLAIGNTVVSPCTTGSLCAIINVGSTYYAATYPASSLSNNTWYHSISTYDGDTLRLYINGYEVANNTTPNGSIYYSINTPLCLGSEANSTVCNVSQYLSGQLDDVRVYNYALTATQVKTLYNGGSLNFR